MLIVLKDKNDTIETKRNTLWRTAKSVKYVGSHHRPDDDLMDRFLDKLEASNVVPSNWRRAIHHLAHDNFNQLLVDVLHVRHVHVVVVVVV